MKYYVNYDVLIVVILLFILFILYYKLVYCVKETFQTQVDYLQPSPFRDTNRKDIQMYLNNLKKVGIKKIRSAFEANNYPCSPGYYTQSTDFWGQPIQPFQRNTC